MWEKLPPLLVTKLSTRPSKQQTNEKFVKSFYHLATNSQVLMSNEAGRKWSCQQSWRQNDQKGWQHVVNKPTTKHQLVFYELEVIFIINKLGKKVATKAWNKILKVLKKVPSKFEKKKIVNKVEKKKIEYLLIRVETKSPGGCKEGWKQSCQRCGKHKYPRCQKHSCQRYRKYSC